MNLRNTQNNDGKGASSTETPVNNTITIPKTAIISEEIKITPLIIAAIVIFVFFTFLTIALCFYTSY